MTALIDADIVAYRCSAVSENDPVDVACVRTDLMMRDILALEEQYIAFLTGKDNFRYKLNPEYKANRKDKPRPIHLPACRDFLIQEYKATVIDGYEADDALGWNQTNETTIFSIDKDLLMIPGCHYNFVKKEFSEVSELEGLKSFYRQALIGDTSDNIFGVKGIGKVKAGKEIDHLETEKEMYETVARLYDGDNKRLVMNLNCLWIQRKQGQLWEDRYEVQ